MRYGRTILATLLALAVALLPLPGAMAHMPSEQSLHEADCCHQGVPCEDNAPDCQSPAGCTLKCFSISGAIPGGTVLSPFSGAAKGLLGGAQRVHAPANAPPLPPPRV